MKTQIVCMSCLKERGVDTKNPSMMKSLGTCSLCFKKRTTARVELPEVK